jgi:lysophospholipase L1-like esterase
MLLFVNLIVTISIIELLCRQMNKAYWAKRNERYEPTYAWSMFTQQGVRISRHQGVFKLMLHPSRLYSNYPNQHTAHFTIGDQGYRRKDFGPKESSRARIVILGASTAFGTGLASDQDAIDAQLEKISPNTDVINAAVLGYLSGQELSCLMTEIIDLKPTRVIVINGYNDYRLIGESVESRWIDMNGLGHIESELGIASQCQYAHLFKRWTLLKGIFLADTIEALSRTKFMRKRRRKKIQTIAKHHILDEQTIIQSYTQNVFKMKQLCDSRGIQFECVLQPSRPLMWKSFNPREADSYGSFCQNAKAIFRESKIEHIDLNEFTDVFNPDMFMDKAHLNAEGQIALATLLCNENKSGTKNDAVNISEHKT